jgi:hypothetical protein
MNDLRPAAHMLLPHAASELEDVGPADYAYKLKGQPVKEVGSIFTFALQKGPPAAQRPPVHPASSAASIEGSTFPPLTMAT